MDAWAAVMTGSGAGAIATIQLCGRSAHVVLAQIFQPSGNRAPIFRTGRILLGHIVDGRDSIDQVTIGCERTGTFAIHCHGNPIIVERIMKLLQSCGVELLAAESLLANVLAAERPGDSIAIEARLALTKVKTVEGARIIATQMEGGLSERVRQWSCGMDSVWRSEIADQARQILRDSEVARPIVAGGTIALVGPPNTGKSTLLNVLAGCEKAIVTDVSGTTRDWVASEILMGPLAATVIDTAGFDVVAARDDEIDGAAQARSVEILRTADLVLLVLDLSRPEFGIDAKLLETLAGKRVLTVLNKSDLPPRLDPAALPARLDEPVRISAKQATGLDDLIGAIGRTLGVADLDPYTPIAFTPRQRALLERLASAAAPSDPAAIVATLRHGPIEG